MPPATLQLLGWSLVESRAYPQAAQLLRRAQMRYPGDVGINEILGYLHLRVLRRNGEAARFYAAAHAAQPHHVNLTFNLGYALLRNGDVDDAASAFSEVIRLKPEFAEAYAWRAEAKLSWPSRPAAFKPTPDADKALADANQAIERDGTFAPAWAARGRARCRLKQWDAALGDLSRAVELDPNCAYAWNALAWTLAMAPDEALRDPDRAVEASLRATTLDAFEGDFLSTLALAYFRAGNATKAIAVVDEATDWHNARNGVDWIVLAMCHAQLGHHDPAAYCHYRAVKWAQLFRPTDDDLRRLVEESAVLVNSIPPGSGAP
jgi:tetratricopeptide (TPR) repeat protein